MTTVLEFTAINAFWIVVGSISLSRKLKKHKRLVARDLQKMLWQDRQIRRDEKNGRITGGDSSRGSGTGSG